MLSTLCFIAPSPVSNSLYPSLSEPNHSSPNALHTFPSEQRAHQLISTSLLSYQYYTRLLKDICIQKLPPQSSFLSRSVLIAHALKFPRGCSSKDFQPCSKTLSLQLTIPFFPLLSQSPPKFQIKDHPNTIFHAQWQRCFSSLMSLI